LGTFLVDVLLYAIHACGACFRLFPFGTFPACPACYFHVTAQDLFKPFFSGLDCIGIYPFENVIGRYGFYGWTARSFSPCFFVH
jgi:hypothetical protein